MSQGAPADDSTTEPPQHDDLDLDAWLVKRGLSGERRLRVGGSWFRFRKTVPPETLVQYNKLRGEGDLAGAIATLLVDPAEAAELSAAFDRQAQPITAQQENEFFVAILNHLLAGEAGESSAS